MGGFARVQTTVGGVSPSEQHADRSSKASSTIKEQVQNELMGLWCEWRTKANTITMLMQHRICDMNTVVCSLTVRRCATAALRTATTVVWTLSSLTDANSWAGCRRIGCKSVMVWRTVMHGSGRFGWPGWRMIDSLFDSGSFFFFLFLVAWMYNNLWEGIRVQVSRDELLSLSETS